MAFFMDGFDYYNTTAQQQSVWDTSENVAPSAIGAGVFGYGRAVSINVTGQQGLTFANIPGAGAGQWATIYACYHWQFGQAGNDTKQLLQLIDGATNQLNLRLTAGNVFKLYRNAALLATGATALVIGQWYWLSIKAVINGAAGSFRLDIFGPGVNVTEFNVAGANTQNTANAYATKLRFEGVNSAAGNSVIDNVHIYDGADAAPWNAVSTERRIYFNLPTGDGALSQWAASAGADWQCVDENPPTDDTDYISTATATDRSLFTTGAFTNITVDAVKLSMRARRDDAGPRGIKLTARIGGVNYDSAEFLQGATYTYQPKYWLTSPATAAAWGLAEVNGTEWGVLLST